MTADFILAIIVTDELKELRQMMMSQIKNRYGGIIDDSKFIMGIDYSKMKLFSLDSGSAVPLLDKKKSQKIEIANDTFNIDMGHQIKTTNSFDDFNFD